MQLLKNIADRIIPPTYQHPPAPTTAQESDYTMLLSIDDDTQPSPRLLSLAIDATEAALNTGSLSHLAGRKNLPERFFTWPGEHYRLLAGLMTALRPKQVIEIETGLGLSTLALAASAADEARISTFDSRPWKSVPQTVLTPEDFAGSKLKQEVGNLAAPGAMQQFRPLLETSDLIVLNESADPASVDGVLQQLRSLNFSNAPILLIDGIRHWNMLRTWRMLPYPKFDLTSFGHWSGSGLVDLA